jgi:hypothetical protein
MHNPGADQQRCATPAGTIGVLVVAGYALVGVLQVLVWNPLAAAPGAALGEINAHLERANETLAAPLVLGWALTGTALATGVLVAALRRHITTVRGVVALDLLILVLAAPSLWLASFPAGMGIADAYGTTGADHAPWGMALYALSAVALVVLMVLLATMTVGGKKWPADQSTPGAHAAPHA